MIFTVVAIVVSVVALATSTYTALAHQALQKAANFSPSYLQFTRQLQAIEFHDHYAYVTTKLGSEHDPKLGISGLPDDARRAVYDIVYFLYGYGMLQLIGVLDDLAALTARHRVVTVWDAIAPYVERERELGGPSDLRMLEEFAKDVRALPHRSLLNSLLGRRRVFKNRRSLHRAIRHLQ